MVRYIMKTIYHKFVDYIPDELEEDILYISIKYATAVHKCFCGCQEEVVTPLSPIDWQLTFDGRTVSLYPSIGNWSYSCRSHYWINNDNVVWAEQWLDEEVKTSREDDKSIRLDYFKATKKSLWQRLRGWFS